ncbi:hypothetical protein EJB05_23083 [Eragrostis curvula]|uniref:Uncharacterized protein n=1 Tax=Eragrostis curvula TaxID=38414 RepID=A0A5J9V5J2_9POAL|nr:hypothetical protein EJB05_23083 [Eragrostis curvula]
MDIDFKAGHNMIGLFQVLSVVETVGCHQDWKVGFFALLKYKELIRANMAYVLNFNPKHGKEMAVNFRREERKHMMFAWPVYLECDQRYDGMGKSTKEFTQLYHFVSGRSGEQTNFSIEIVPVCNLFP